MSRQWSAVGIICLLLLGLIVVGWFNRDRFTPVEPGSRAPDFVAQTIAGERVRFSDLGGEVVLLNIWATWCPPCIEEMPSIQRLYEKLGPQGLRVVAVSIDAAQGRRDGLGNQGGDVEEFARSLGLTFPIWRDPDGAIQRIYWTRGVPETFLIGRDGYISKKHPGPLEWDSPAIVESVTRLLANDAP